ncbi:hypothetical protein FB451DRAFT_1307528 [Mycena latifolia]|nr:hypothetical protein FB451DRAFT_1307528 [Mycena latifolia]
MHRALQIQELVEMILSHLDPLPGADSPALAALASTCTIFHDSALDALWRHQETIVNLIKCMPSDLWASVRLTRMQIRGRNTLRLTRPITGSDWDRLLKYSGRVKSLICADYFPHPDLSKVFDAIHLHFPGEYLLPNLETLGWTHRYPARINLFLGPRISSIDLGRCNVNAQQSILPSLGSRYPGLRAVTVKNSPHELDTNSQVSAFVCALSNVSFLEVDTLDVTALRHLGQLSSLKTLNFAMTQSTSLSFAADGTMFRSLCSTTVDLEHGQLNDLSAFVRTWASPPVHTFSATISASPTPDAIGDFYRVLSAHCFHDSLKSLKLDFSQFPPFAVQNEFVHPGHFFRVLFCFANLTVLSIQTPVGYDLDDEIVAEIAQAWPCIEELCLRGNARPSCRLSTFLGLSALAEHCPLLRTLEMTFDASNVPLLGIHQGQRALQTSLVSLDACQSPITDAFSVARFLSSIFVNLKEVDSEADEEDLLTPHYHQRWMEVGRMLPRFDEMREQEWNHGNDWAMQKMFEATAIVVGDP